MSSGSWNILLYFGLGLMCVGSVIAFVGEDQSLGKEWAPQIKVSIEKEHFLVVRCLEN